jgi:hypothetical protein
MDICAYNMWFSKLIFKQFHTLITFSKLPLFEFNNKYRQFIKRNNSKRKRFIKQLQNGTCLTMISQSQQFNTSRTSLFCVVSHRVELENDRESPACWTLSSWEMPAAAKRMESTRSEAPESDMLWPAKSRISRIVKDITDNWKKLCNISWAYFQPNYGLCYARECNSRCTYFSFLLFTFPIFWCLINLILLSYIA